MSIALEDVYKPSDDVVAREIEGEIIIVPLVAGIGDMEDELFTLNDTGKAIWDTLDRRRGLACVVATARNPQSKEAEDGAIERDGLASSPSSSRATCWSPPEPGQGRRRFCFGAARRDVAAHSAPPKKRSTTVGSERDDSGAVSVPSPEAGGGSPWTSRREEPGASPS